MTEVLDRVHKILNREFKKNRKMYLAASHDDRPLVKIFNMVYHDESFYLVTSVQSEMAQMLLKNPKASICSAASFHKFQGSVINLGHLLLRENQEVRSLLLDHMDTWYTDHYDENDPDLCFFQIDIHKGFTYSGKTGYHIDFKKHEIERVSL